MNGGIRIVRRSTGRMKAVEKRFTSKDIDRRVAKSEIRALLRLGGHPNITTMVDYYVSGTLRRGSIFLEYYNKGSLEDMIGEKNVS